ncbi:MAG: methyl-accepting chemotaxis protein [Burkholderiaceae bacterium]
MAFEHISTSSKKNEEPLQQDAVLAAASIAAPVSGSSTGLERLLDVKLALIGHLAPQKQIRLLLILVGAALLLSAFFVWYSVNSWTESATQNQIAGDALMHSQRIGKAAPNAIQGNLEAFKQLENSRSELDSDLKLLTSGGNYLGATIESADAAVLPRIKETQKIWGSSEQAANTILTLKKGLIGFGTTQKNLNSLSLVMLGLTEQIATQKLQFGSTPREILIAGRLRMLTQRLERNANFLLSAEGASSETAALLRKDIDTFRDIVDGFLNGNDALKLTADKDPDIRVKLNKLQKVFAEYQLSVALILDNLQNFIAAKDAEQLLFNENETLKQHIGSLQATFRAEQNNWGWPFWMLLASVFVALLAAAGVALMLLQDSRGRAREAEAHSQEAERQQHLAQSQEEQAKSSNNLNQAAILRLMNELQEVADGDLTVQATVSEDITGAIADSVNYTVEELRLLVGRVTDTATQVTSASNQAQSVSADLLLMSQQHAREIENAGQSILQMAEQITDVSRSANQSADVARQSVAAAEQGSKAVENAIKGMAEIREQIQETSKRIKRLGESSQEIGEITELISDITEQTNVLALNAAIQAASAGEAGRGFSVVAEEVQRLAERSGAATKQIGALVRTIQTDTFDAVAAMEQSTQGVVEGAKLSDAAGAALTDISRISNRLAELIQGISYETEQQATSANSVAQTIQHILSVTEQTKSGTQQTAQSIQELSVLAEELKSSVSRFRVAA